MILNNQFRTVPARVAMCTRAVADALESAGGWHLIAQPLPTELQLIALSKTGGKDIDKINELRAESGLHLVSENTNVKSADAKWKGLTNGTGAYFRIVHNGSVGFPEFLDKELMPIIGDVCALHDKASEVLHNKKFSVIYIYEPTAMPD